jgi:ribosome-associated protein
VFPHRRSPNTPVAPGHTSSAFSTIVVRSGQGASSLPEEAIDTPVPDATPRTPTWLIAVRAAESKKAADIKVLDLAGITSFADWFVICTGANQRQVQAIADEVGLRIKREAGELPLSLEGYNQAEWVLADYGDLLVHIFSPTARAYYDLERLWRTARPVEVPPE